jgi:hypothetical protein
MYEFLLLIWIIEAVVGQLIDFYYVSLKEILALVNGRKILGG